MERTAATTVDMSPAAVSRRIRRVAGLLRLHRKMIKNARVVEVPADKVQEPPGEYNVGDSDQG